jgi:hypothetical protein
LGAVAPAQLALPIAERIRRIHPQMGMDNAGAGR